jgi:alpha-beta hydrolase superfamily lysophospholipase
VHGLGEHSGRYADVADLLAAGGFMVFAPDLRGHGISRGARGHVDSFDQYTRDIEALRIEIAGPGPSPPLFLVGHSLGGLIVVRYLQQFARVPCAAAAISAPALRLAKYLAPPLLPAVRVLARFAPRASFDNGLDATELSRDTHVVAAYRDDPLVHSRITARLYVEMLDAMRRAASDADRMRVRRLLVMAPGQDSIIDQDGTLEFAGLIPPTTRIDIRTYPDARHEPFNDTGGAAASDLLDWLPARDAV